MARCEVAGIMQADDLVAGGFLHAAVFISLDQIQAQRRDRGRHRATAFQNAAPESRDPPAVSPARP